MQVHWHLLLRTAINSTRLVSLTPRRLALGVSSVSARSQGFPDGVGGPCRSHTNAVFHQFQNHPKQSRAMECS